MDILRKLNENNVVDKLPSDLEIVKSVISSENAKEYIDESYINYLLMGQQLSNNMSIDEKIKFITKNILDIKKDNM